MVKSFCYIGETIKYTGNLILTIKLLKKMGGGGEHEVNNFKNEPLEYIHLKLIITPRITNIQLAAIQFWKHFITSNNSIVQKKKCIRTRNQQMDKNCKRML